MSVRSPVRAVLLGCSQDAGVPQMGCSCRQCGYARCHPDYEDGMVACLGVVDEVEGKVFLVDATPNLRRQLWAIQHSERRGGNERPLELGGILLTHAHTGHYTGLLQLGKEEADTRGVPVFCTPSMAKFLRNNQPWAQLTERGNISIREIDSMGADGDAASVRLTPSISFLAVDVPHRSELSDTVAYVVSLSNHSGAAGATVSRSEVDTGSAGRVVGRDGGGEKALKLLYCPDTDGWTGWTRSIKDWCEEVDVALLDATFYDKDELKGRNMSEVSHPIAQDTMKELTGCKAEVVFVHLNHTNPLLAKDSPERAKALAAGFKVGTFGMEWTPPLKHAAEPDA